MASTRILFAKSLPQSWRIVTRHMGRNPGAHGFAGYRSEVGSRNAGETAQLRRRAGSAMQAAIRARSSAG
jgi:hypothetical protein